MSYREEMTPDLVAVGVISALQLCCVSTLLYQAWTTRLAPLHRVACTIMDGFGKGSAEGLDAEATAHVEQILSVRRREIAKASAVVGWILAAVSAFSVHAQLFVVDESIAPNSSVWPRVVMLAVLTVVGLLRDRLLQDRFLPIAHLVCIFSLAAVSGSQVQSHLKAFQSVFVLILSLVLAGLCLRVRVLLASNLILLLATEMSIIINVSIDDPGFGPALATEVFVFLVKMVLFVATIWAMRSLVVQQVHAGRGKCQQSAVGALLDMMCDAVVDTDENMCLKDQAPRLAGMLMLGPGRCRGGEKFQAFVADDDRMRVVRSMKAERNNSDESGGSQAPSMHTALLRDAIGNRIKTTLYHVPYLSVSGRVHHLIGLREDNTEDGRLSASLGADFAQRLRLAGLKPMPYKPPRSSTSGSERGQGDGENAANSRADSDSQSNASATTPNFIATAIVFLANKIPIRTVADGFLDDFGLMRADGEQGNFGDLCPDAGASLLESVSSAIREGEASGVDGPCVRNLGDFELLRSKDGGPARKVKRSISVYFKLPMPKLEPGAAHIVGVSVGRAQGRQTSTVGTPRSMDREALGGRRREGRESRL